jgi:isopentenyl diphosphate isomerase/L-lactate dehydrogenase-like FMN-dependent dehydrogenase
MESADAVRAVIRRIKKEFVTAMFLLGARTVDDLKGHGEIILK